jgi:hypothetical protein
VEEVPTIHAQLAAAQAPIGPQQKMEFENAMLEVVENAAAHQSKVRNKLLILAAPDGFLLAAVVPFDGDAAHGPLSGGAITKAGVARAKDRPKNAIAGRFIFQAAKSQSAALGAIGRRKRERVGSGPFHDVYFLPGEFYPAGLSGSVESTLRAARAPSIDHL